MCAKKLKTNKNYYFSVEGDTEGWYLDYLQKLINNCSKATCTVKLKHKKLMPTRYAKTLANITEEEVYHLCDYESDSEDDVKKLQDPEYVAKYAREKYLYTKEGEYVIDLSDLGK